MTYKLGASKYKFFSMVMLNWAATQRRSTNQKHFLRTNGIL